MIKLLIAFGLGLGSGVMILPVLAHLHGGPTPPPPLVFRRR